VVADAQTGYEALMTLMPTFLAGVNRVMHSAGWLEGGLVAGFEKFIVDVELLQMMRAEFTPLEIDEASLAFGAHEEVGHGGHFLGAMHTMECFRLLLPAAALLVGELRTLDAQRCQRHQRPRHEGLQVDAGGLRAAGAGRRDPTGARGVRRTTAGRARRLTSGCKIGWGLGAAP